MDLDGKAIELIQASARAEHVERDLHGLLFSTKRMEPVFFDPRPDTLGVHSLTALSDFLAANIDKLDPTGHLLHVESPLSVALLSMEEGPARKRTVWARATVDGNAFKFNERQDPETFNIGLQSLFVDSDDRAVVLQVAGTIKSEEAETAIDDGVTQTVEARRGVALAQTARVPNPVTLRPWRTFREIVQPSSLFVLRVHEGPRLALYEADGSAWKLEAMQSIKAWLTQNLKTPIAVIA